MEFVGWIAVLVMGLTLGLLGGGGSILTVPIFVYLFGIQATAATGYSLFVVGATALVGSLAYLRRGEIDLKTAAVFAPPSFLGVYLTRRTIVPALPDRILSLGGFTLTRDEALLILFALLMLATAVSMIRSRDLGEAMHSPPRREWVKIMAEGLVVGVLTGLVGAGGGFLIIPALVLLAGVPMKVAVGTSLLIIAAKSLLGFIGEVQQAGPMDWSFLLGTTVLAAGGILAGSRVAVWISNEKLKPAFGGFLVLMGLYMLGREIML